MTRFHILRNTLAVASFYVVVAVACVLTANARSSARPVPLVICDVFGDRYCGEALRVEIGRAHV